MCFAIPQKVLEINKNNARVEGGKIVKLGTELQVKKGEFLQVVGNVAVGKLSQSEGLKIRKLIKRLNSYESAN